MSEYQLTDPMTGGVVIRTEDGANIPSDPGNRDYAEYLKWVEAGGVPDPYVPPPVVEPVPTDEQQLLYDHENRLRAIEGQPPLTQAEFAAMRTGAKAATPEPEQDPSRRKPPPRHKR